MLSVYFKELLNNFVSTPFLLSCLAFLPGHHLIHGPIVAFCQNGGGGTEGNQKHVQNEAGQSGTKNSSEEAPTEDVGEFTALIYYVIRRNDEVSAPVCLKAKLKDSHNPYALFKHS